MNTVDFWDFTEARTLELIPWESDRTKKGPRACLCASGRGIQPKISLLEACRPPVHNSAREKVQLRGGSQATRVVGRSESQKALTDQLKYGLREWPQCRLGVGLKCRLSGPVPGGCLRPRLFSQESPGIHVHIQV